MHARRTPVQLPDMNAAVLQAVEPVEYREELQASMEISALCAPDFRKQIAILRET